jgi:hypothetical protein
LLTPLSVPEALFAGVLISLAGFMGDLTISVASLLCSKLLARWTPRRKLFLFGGCWVAFYTGYLLATAGG